MQLKLGIILVKEKDKSAYVGDRGVRHHIK
jgi:hypothetical protein